MTTATTNTLTPVPAVELPEHEWRDLHNLVYTPGVSEVPMISASLCGTILGRNPYKSAYTLFQQLMGRVPWETETPEMRAGKAAEPEVALRYERETGRMTTNPGDYAIHVHPEFSWLFATLDRVDDTGRAVELKSPSLFNVSEWEDGAPPLTAQLQNQIQIACSGLERGALCAVPRGRESAFYHFDFERHDKAIRVVIAACIEFRERIANDDPPPIDTTASTIETIRRLHADDSGLTVDKPELAPVIKAWLAAKDSKKAAEARVDELQAEIIAAIGTASYLTADGYSLKFLTEPRKAFSVKASNPRVLRICK